MPTKNLSVMFTDIKGFTQRTSASTREAIKHMMNEHARLLIPVFQYFEGTVVKTIGDAYLVHFASPTDAVLCGVTIQEVLRQHNKDISDELRLDIRVAINVGDVELLDNDIMGEPVNIAARLEGIAEPGQVYFTEAVYQTMNRLEAPSAEVGEHVFKGIPHPIRVYKVIDDEGSDLAKRLSACVSLSSSGPVIEGIRTRLVQQQKKPVKANILIAAAAVVLATVVFFLLPSERDKHFASAELLATQQDYINALSLIDVDLRKDPTDSVLREFALTLATSHIDTLVNQGQPEAASAWLTSALKNNVYLEPLRPQLAILDARIVVKNNPLANNYIPFYDLAKRNPNDTEGLYIAAQLLQKSDNYGYMPIWLYNQAIDRGGYTKDKTILQYCLHLLKTTRRYNSLKLAHKIIKNNFPEQGLIWSKATINTGTAAEVQQAFRMLKSFGDPLSDSPYMISLSNLIRGKELDNGLKVFLTEKDEGRRQHILSLHQEVVDKYPRFFNYGDIRDNIKKNKALLVSNWKP